MFQKNLLLIPLVIVLYFCYQFVFIGNDEKQIKKLFNEVKAIVAIDGTLKKQEILGRTLRLKKIISKDIQLSAFESEQILFETDTFDSIQGAAFLGAKFISEHSALIQDLDIDVNDETAQAELVIVSSGTTIENEKFRELLSAQVKLQKIDDKWVIISASAERMTSDYD